MTVTMTATEAIRSRRSIRAFLDRPVPEALLREAVATASWAASNSNLQPWLVRVVAGRRARELKARARERATWPPQPDPPGFPIYPEPLVEPYAGRRFRCGENQYGVRGIARDDAEARMRYVYGNHQFFGAPAALFCFLDRSMGPSQWADCGAFIQCFMLALHEAGVDSCAQISWQMIHRTVRAFFGLPEHWQLYCGVSVGYRDPADPINRIEPGRAPLSEFAEFWTDPD